MDALNYIYLDNHSTTKIDRRVLDTMMPFFIGNYGNASSDNLLGNAAKIAMRKAKEQIAAVINASSDEIYFTSGATEAINWAIRGVAEKSIKKGGQIIVSTLEHSSVLKVCDFLEREHHFSIIRINPKPDGLIDPNDIKNAITPKTALIAIQHANNEIGTIQPIKEIGIICKEANVPFFVDAAQSLGKISCDVSDLGVDLLAASGHKIYGPKGIGFLFIKESFKAGINPLLYGGGQEDNFRAGTPNIPSIAGFGRACEICQQLMEEESTRLLCLRNKLIETIFAKVPDMIINGTLNKRLPGNLNFSVPGVLSDVLIRNLSNIVISKGSACNSSRKTQSHVLQSISLDDAILDSAIRIGIGRFNTEHEILFAADKIATAIEEIKISNAQF
jgi:cysteine desulfurase